MIVKKYRARTIEEIQKDIEKELGPNSVIIHSRRIRQKGLKAWIFPEVVEVLAGVEENAMQKRFNEKDLLLNLKNASKRLHTLPPSGEESPFQKALATLLVDHGLSAQHAQRLSQELHAYDEKELADYLKRDFTSHLLCTGPFTLQEDKPTVICIMGPSGVGKTTMSKKLASYYAVDAGKKVALLALHSHLPEEFRGGDKVIHSLNSIIDNKELYRKIEAYSNHELILLDFWNVNPYHEGQLKGLKQLFSDLKDKQLYLTFAANQDFYEMQQMLKKFPQPIKGIFLTKCDEACRLGKIIRLCQEFQIPVSYVSENFDDLQLANPESLSRTIVSKMELELSQLYENQYATVS